MQKFIILVLCYLPVTFDAFSQQKRISTRIDSLFDMIAAYKLLNGAVQITTNNHTIYKSAFGYADFAARKPNTDTTTFALGSVSKIFTSIAVLQLRDRGRCGLDDPFARYFPEFPYERITIRQLLSHTSGLPDYGIFEAAIARQPEKVFTNADIIPLLQKLQPPTAFQPGEKWQYCNLNFCLLALLVDKLSGMPFEKYLTAKIFKPAGMADTYFHTGKQVKPARQALHHDYPLFIQTQPVNADSIKKTRWRTFNLNGLVGQGNIFSTTADMARFDQALYGNRLLKPASLDEAMRTGRPNVTESALGPAGYGLGWFVLQDSTHGRIVFHTGGVPGAICAFVRDISRRQSFVLFDNAFSPNVFAIARNILKIWDHEPADPLKKSLTRDYVTALSQKGVDAAFVKLTQLRSDSLHYFLSEHEMNELGLQLLYAGKTASHTAEALEVLKLNTLLFPLSFNTYDSYGEALAVAGKKEEAIWMYKKSLEINPQSKGGQEALAQLLK